MCVDLGRFVVHNGNRTSVNHSEETLKKIIIIMLCVMYTYSMPAHAAFPS